MIPPDVASRLRLVTQDLPAPAQPPVAAQKLTDVLAELVPGQRVMAEIQALLPNGTYRAMVAQRDITLALPFSAKPGDSLELEVVDNDGKLALAVVADRNAAGAAKESVSATLSQTGRLIGDLLGKATDPGGRAATPLNGNQPLVEHFPEDPAQLAPVLKEALAKSGMFYEAHQARWAEGKLPTAALLQEPQGKLSPILAGQPSGAEAAKAATDAGNPPASASTDSATRTTTPNPVAPDLTPLVRQQLDALATQNFVWQGQVWPGQQMHWEIQEDPDGRRQASEAGNPEQWQTRLQLTLPGLGGIDAAMRLRPGGAVELTLVTDSEASRQKLAAAGEALRRQLDDAGLGLAAMTVRHEQTAP